MPKILLQLEPTKTVELSGFNVSGSNTLSMFIRLVELELDIQYSYDFSGYLQWKKDNPTKTWRDFVKPVLLAIYDSYALAKQVKQILDSEAT